MLKNPGDFIRLRIPGDFICLRIPGDFIRLRIPGDFIRLRIPGDFISFWKQDGAFKTVSKIKISFIGRLHLTVIPQILDLFYKMDEFWDCLAGLRFSGSGLKEKNSPL